MHLHLFLKHILAEVTSLPTAERFHICLMGKHLVLIHAIAGICC